MALTRIGSSAAEFFTIRSSLAASRSKPGLHGSVVRQYPEAPSLALPANVSSIIGTETGRFGSERSRDLATPELLHQRGWSDSAGSVRLHQLDARLDSYDCFGALSLNGSMQSNVPQPVRAGDRSTYLNMPGGSRAADSRLLADVMTEAHFASCQSHNLDKLRRGSATGRTNSWSISRSYSTSTDRSPSNFAESNKSKNPGDDDVKPVVELSKNEKLQIIIRDYGKTVLVFHIAVSLVSLGFFYFLVSSGMDLTSVIKLFDRTDGESTLVSKIMGEGSTFLVAYAMHKLFAPLRVSVTLGLTPMLVKYLRRKGIIKPPKINIQK